MQRQDTERERESVRILEWAEAWRKGDDVARSDLGPDSKGFLHALMSQ